MSYLVYDSASDEIIVADTKPPGYTSMRHLELIFNQVPVWHEPGLPVGTVLLAIRVLLTRKNEFPFAEINSAVAQIVAQYHPDEYAFVALGASPKMIKWILKRKGYETVSINVSKVHSNVGTTKEFELYVRGKLDRIRKNKIVLFDYVNSGEGVAEIKTYLSRLWNKGPIMAVALGVGPKFQPGGAYAQQIDYIVLGIPELTKGFEALTYKKILGRNKVQRDYATYPNIVPIGKVFDGDKVRFANYKSSFARAAELGPFNLSLGDFVEMVKSESHDLDDDEELVW